ncbi:MAG: hypothetical protein ACREJV_14525 [Candidatus Rokuibacteriota bacterium]
MTDRIINWLIKDLTWGGVFVGATLFLVTTIGSLLLVGFLLVKLPATYFQEFHSRDVWVDRHPVLRLTARSGKNVLGAILVVVGTIMALPGAPGQGLLTILVGLMLLDLPGKRRLERRILGRPRLLRAINRLRKRFGSPPLVLGSRRGEVRRKRLSHSVSGTGGRAGRIL